MAENQVKKIRKSRNISQKDMAIELKMLQSSYSKRESGEIEFKLSELNAIAKILQVPVSELYGGIEPPKIVEEPVLNYKRRRNVPEYIARKSKKSRKLVIPKQLMQLLLENEYHLCEPDMYIFSKGGKPGYNRVGKNYFSRAFSKFREAFKIPIDYKLYGFKHTGNSKLASIGVNAQLQQKHNGHASLEYTQRYNSNLSHADTKFLQEQFPSFAQAGKSLFTESNQKQEFSQEQLLSIARMMKNLLQNTETNAD